MYLSEPQACRYIQHKYFCLHDSADMKLTKISWSRFLMPKFKYEKGV